MNPTATRASSAGTFATSPRTRVDHDQVRRLHSQGVGVQNIAVQLGASMEDVRRILNPVEQPTPKPRNDNARPAPEDVRAERDARFRRMWLAGETRPAMAAVFGMDIYSIDRKRARLGLPTRSKIYRGEQT